MLWNLNVIITITTTKMFFFQLGKTFAIVNWLIPWTHQVPSGCQPSDQPIHMGCESACKLLSHTYSFYCVPWRIEGWAELTWVVGHMLRWFICPQIVSIPVVQTMALESLQHRVLSDLSMKSATTQCHWAKLDWLDMLVSRRKQLTKCFFKRSVLPETLCLHYLLPDTRDVSVTGRVHHTRTFEPLKSRNSFIPYCLDYCV